MRAWRRSREWSGRTARSSWATTGCSGTATCRSRDAGIGGGAGPSRAAAPASALLLVHHGLFWDGNVPLTGRRYRRVRALLERGIALYAAHIPLDVHAEVGNNHVLARQIGLGGIEPFDSYRGIPIGVQGPPTPPARERVGDHRGRGGRRDRRGPRSRARHLPHR